MTEPAQTLAETRAMLEQNVKGWPSSSRRQMLNALDRLVTLTGKDLADLPADETAVAALVDGQLNWRRDGFKTARALRDFRGRLARAARETNEAGLLRFTPRNSWRADWRALLDDLEAAIARGDERPWARRALAHLAGYANSRGIGPADVDSSVLADLLALHARNKGAVETAKLTPADYARKAIDSACAWNRLVRDKHAKPWLGRLPATILEWDGRARVVNPPLTAYPADFQTDVGAYLASLTAPRTRTLSDDPDDPFGPIPPELESFEAWESAGGDQVQMTDVYLPDDPASGPRRKRYKEFLRPATIANHRHWILQTAAAVVRRGVKPSDQLHGLRDICTYPAIHAAVNDYVARQKARPDGEVRKESASAFQLAETMCGIAERWAGAPPGYVAKMRQMLRQHTRTESCGAMSVERLRLLRQFDQPGAVSSWFDRPRALFEKAEKRRKNGETIRASDITDVEVGIVCRILGILPVRRRTLATIRCKGDRPNLQLRRHRSEKSWVMFWPDDVKNERYLRAELDRETERMIRIYLEHWRPRYLEMRPQLVDSDFLFVGGVCDAYGDGHRDFATLGNAFSERMAQAGLQMTLHLSRHVAGKIIVDWDIRHVGTVADLLGNSERTVRKFYVADRSAQASKTLHDIVEAKQPVLVREWVD